MNKAKVLLQKMTELIPPGNGMRHNLTLNGDSVELTLMTENKYIAYLLDDSDMANIDTLVMDLFVAAKKELKNEI